MYCRQLQERAQRNALAAENAKCLEHEIQQHEAAHANQRQQKSKVFSSCALTLHALWSTSSFVACMMGPAVTLQDAAEQQRRWTADQMAQQLEFREQHQLKAERMADAMAHERWGRSDCAIKHP